MTLDGPRLAARAARYAMLRERARAGDCDLVIHGRLDGEARGLLYLGGELFQSDRTEEQLSEGELAAALVAGAVLTVTAVPPGAGARQGIDRDEDGHLDSDEVDLRSSPTDAASVPVASARFLRGDCDNDGAIDLGDSLSAIFRLFGAAGVPDCEAACDANADDRFDVGDPIFVLDFLFRGGLAPAVAPICERGRDDCRVGACPW